MTVYPGASIPTEEYPVCGYSQIQEMYEPIIISVVHIVAIHSPYTHTGVIYESILREVRQLDTMVTGIVRISVQRVCSTSYTVVLHYLIAQCTGKHIGVK